MKKALSVLFGLAVVLSLATPASAVRWQFWKRGKSQATENSKAQEKQAKKKAAAKGKKAGQEGTTSDQGNRY